MTSLLTRRGLVASALALAVAWPLAARAENKGREITYKMTSSGLIIEVDGVELAPKAEPVKTAKGWMVSLSVKATGRDDKAHTFLSPKNGPLMVAAEIDRGGKVESIPDTRNGDGEQSLPREGSTSLDRNVNIAIGAGQKLTLHVGLWGLAKEGEERRPVRKLFVLKMVSGTKKPQPVITPPE